MADTIPKAADYLPPNVYKKHNMNITTPGEYYNICDTDPPSAGHTRRVVQDFEVKETEHVTVILSMSRLKIITCALVTSLVIAVALNVILLILYVNKGNNVFMITKI